MPYPLVVVYGRLARYDKMNGNKPFAGGPGAMFMHRTLDIANCPYEIRVLGTQDCYRPYPPNARVLLLGEDALSLAGFSGKELSLNKHRGYCLTVQSPGTLTKHAAIATYHPIDCWDFTRVEGDDDDDEDGGDDKDVIGTKRSNYFAWAMKDFWKLVTRAQPLWDYHPMPTPTYIRASHATISEWLENLPAGSRLTLDIECRIQDHILDVIGLRANGRAYVAPIYMPNDRLAFESPAALGRFWRALARTFLRKDVIIVGHNLSFDIAVLAVHAGLPVPYRMFDTMIAMHRQEPFTEKSLSHAIAMYLNTARNHKADICPNVSMANFERLCQYNSEDLLRTEQIMDAQLVLMDRFSELADAINAGNELLHATLMMSLTGIPTCTEATQLAAADHRLRAEQFKRVAAILTNIPDFNPASPDQVADYFYGQLQYPVTEVTETGAPATSAKALYGLQIAQNNPLIPVIIEHRESKKAATSMEFKPLKLPSL